MPFLEFDRSFKYYKHMFLDFSILRRPKRPPSVNNVESIDVQWERECAKTEALKVKHEKLREVRESMLYGNPEQRKKIMYATKIWV